jgi:hypothetical protein
MWIKPRDPTTLTLDGSNRVSDVRDLSSYRTDFTQSTSGNRPYVDAGPYSATGRFRGISNPPGESNWMIRDRGVSVDISDCTIMAAVMWTGNAGVYPAFLTAASNTTIQDYVTGFSMDRGNSNASNPFNTFSMTGPKDNTNTDILNQNISYNTPTVLGGRLRNAAGTVSLSVNGVDQGSYTPASPNATFSIRVLRLFARYYGGIQAVERGIIAEMFVVSRAITDQELRLFEGYIHWACGLQTNLPANHRFFNRPPLIGD